MLVPMIAGLTRQRESIAAATTTAIQAALVDAAPRIVRLVVDAMAAEPSSAQRITMLYLVDSILQVGHLSPVEQCSCVILLYWV